MNDQSWSIIIFCFNEQSTLKIVVEKTLSLRDRLSSKDFEIIIINDGSSDWSQEVAEQLAERYPCVSCIHHPTNLGVGRALLSGYAEAKKENVVAVPADGQFNVDELIPFACVPENTIISFYRDKRGNYSFWRKMLNWGNRWFNRGVLGVGLKDVNWVKIYKRESLARLSLDLKSSLVESEICAKLIWTGTRVREVPSQYYPRQSGKSTVASWRNLKKVLREMPTLVKAVTRYRLTKAFTPQ